MAAPKVGRLRKGARRMDELDRQICELAHQLDEVQFRAVLATAAAMAAGLNNIAALACGNIVLASAGYPSAPVYIPENSDSSR